MAKSRKKSGWLSDRAFKYVFIILSSGGAGAGSWHYRDSILAQFVQKAHEDAGSDESLIVGAIKNKVHDVFGKSESFAEEGRFEVRVEQLEIDSGLFKPGQTIELQVQIAKLDAQGKKVPIWNSQSVDRRIVKVGNTPIATSWQVSPFEVDWAPTDRVVIEVWDHKPLFSTKLFERTEVIEEGGQPVFPLKTGSYTLNLVAKGNKDFDPAVNQVVFQSRRLTDSATNDLRGDHTVPPASSAQRDSDTITIK